MQYPPPSSFRFVFLSNTQSSNGDYDIPARFQAADGEPVNDPTEAGRQVQLFVRPFQQAPSRTIDESWKQQLALISVLGEEETSDEPAVHSGTRGLDASNEPISPKTVLKVAQLLCIMSKKDGVKVSTPLQELEGIVNGLRILNLG
ncbi:predicted protein [Sclerotinia sclerotiorum 1980 UF-70]|uniref:Uncharacterized protein n=1 Tax=Sclerotinia sclerotiorum (strain ATCC 18683 / 1980 / Ss-1) TaxID=665079 RepID=A7EIX0_SCLS1|nr:predicted protein [Sclerotinia sclerotiorum 1980 UF-70]EDO02786.1 predicted protein [Sclerotinia sclerotiorum 1980 UF-70]